MSPASAADGLTDAAVSHAGVVSLLLFLVVTVLSAAGMVLSSGASASGVSYARCGGAVYLTAFALALSAVWPETTASWTLLGYVVLLGLMGLLGSVFLTWLERTMAPWRQET